MIPFNKPPRTGAEDRHVLAAMNADKMSGDGPFGLRCQTWLEQRVGSRKVLLTPSCTQALEMAALLIDIQPGDEVIMPSFTFVSTANAFALRGAKIVFVDLRPDTMNMDEQLIEAAITERTRAIVPVHYAGVACEMGVIMALAEKHGLYVIEDAAQGMMSRYGQQALGGIGHLAAYSFHETKNFTSGGEGGALFINDARFIQRAEIIREKGTNRSKFFRGEVDKYSWVDMGSSYLPGELQAAYLWGQLECAEQITAHRLASWQQYHAQLSLGDLPIALPSIPETCRHNGHMFYIKAKDLDERTALLAHLKNAGVYAVFHYVPLHTAPAGQMFGTFHGEDRYTTHESERLIRLPLFYGITDQQIDYIASCVRKFYS